MNYFSKKQSGFTLVETLVAISVLVVAVAAPMTLASRSLLAAFYAKDQVTASYLAQEAIELVRNRRDYNFIRNLKSGGAVAVDWLDFDGVDADGSKFTIDTRDVSFRSCGATCDNLSLNKVSGLYAYDNGSGWVESRFVRTTTVSIVPGSDNNEAVIKVTVGWSGSFGDRSFTLSEHIYNWIPKI